MCSSDLTISEGLKRIGMTLLSTVGGASGPLYGSAFLQAAMTTKEETDVSDATLGMILQASLKGIQARGKAVKGDKTIIDALEPACDAYFKEIEAGVDIVGAMEAACEAAKAGVEGTKLIVARKGRASYLGERSIGHQDPGATSTLIMLETITSVLKNREE